MRVLVAIEWIAVAETGLFVHLLLVLYFALVGDGMGLDVHC